MGECCVDKNAETFDIVLKGCRKLKSQVPQDILANELLQAAIDVSLPSNYEFEIPKTLWRIRQEKAKHVGLQFPEGLLIFASQIGTILSQFTEWPIDITILGDVTYGACCIDDLTAVSIGIDFLVHYGHSCLVPLDQTALKCLYVFVDIAFDFKPLINCVTRHFATREALYLAAKSDKTDKLKYSTDAMDSNAGTLTSKLLDKDSPPVLVLMGTIQYSSVVHAAAKALRDLYGLENVVVPQELPLTAGEVLGCTSPNLQKLDIKANLIIFVSDGRFHLESVMIHNPDIPIFRYDPFTKEMFREHYDHQSLHKNRKLAIEMAKSATKVGIILGTLGRQGSVGIFEKLKDLLKNKNIKSTLFLMSEIMPSRLERLAKQHQAFIQIACPRLSIDWGHMFSSVPLLSPYEACVAFGNAHYQEVYPMDFYSNDGGEWTNFKQAHRSGSLQAAQFQTTIVTDLKKRKELIRQRAEMRRQKLAAENK